MERKEKGEERKWKGKKGEKRRKKEKKLKRVKKEVKNYLKNVACDTHLKFTIRKTGREFNSKIFLGKRNQTLVRIYSPA